MSEKENRLPSSLETEELSLEACIEMKNEALLKVGVPAAALESITIENAFDGEENPDDPVLCLRYRKDGEIKFQEIFTGNDLLAKHREDFSEQYFFARACLNIAGIFRKDGEEWREGVSNLEYYKYIKDKTLSDCGLPESELSKVVCAVTFLAEELENDSEGAVALNYFFEPGQPPIYMPFKSEEEFREACGKLAGFYKEIKKQATAAIDKIIGELGDRIGKLTGREWTHKPQECPGTYEHDGPKYITRGIKETLIEDEIQLVFVYIRKRLVENDGGIDYLQVMESNDGKKVFVIDQLDRKMKASGDFREEDNYSTMMFAEEY